MRVQDLRRAAARFTNERAQTGHQRGQGFRRGHRPFEQRVLHDAAGRRIDFDGDDVDGGRRGVRLEVEQQQRPQHTRIAHRRRQAEGARVRRPVGEPQVQAQRHAAAIGCFERGGQRFEQPRKDERQRLQQLDRPFELERCDEPAHPGIGDERPRIDAARQALVGDAGRTEPRRQVGGGQCREFADRRQPPPRQDVERPRGACRSAASRTRSAGGRIKVGVDLGGEILKDGEWNVMQRLSRIAGRDGDASAGAGQQDRRGLRDGDRHLRRAGTREMLGYRARVAEQPLQAGHIEHDRAAGTPFDARRKLPRDRHQPIEWPPRRLVQRGVEFTGV